MSSSSSSYHGSSWHHRRDRTFPVAGIVCRCPVRSRWDENAGLRQVFELASTSSPVPGQPQQLYSHGCSSCKCRSLLRFRHRRRRPLAGAAATPRLEAGGTHLGLRLHGSRRGRGILRGESSMNHTGGSSSSSSSTKNVDGDAAAVIELVPAASKTDPVWNLRSASSTSSPRCSKSAPKPPDQDANGLLLVTSDKFIQEEGEAVVKLSIGGAPKYIRFHTIVGSAAEGGTSEHPAWQLALPHVAVATLASVLFGYHIGVVNVPLQYIAQDLGFAGSTISEGLLVSLLLGAAFVGCAASGLVADGIGRRHSFQLSTIPMIIGSVLCAVASALDVMLVGRVLVGLGLGLSGPLAALYVSEISPTAVRGAYGSLLQVASCSGILGALIAGLPSSSIAGWWRVCFWISTGPAVLLAVAMQFCAESPRWLFKKQQYGKAQSALHRLWGPAHVKEAIADLMREEQLESGRSSSWSDLLDRRYIKVVLIGAALFAFQQLAGINAVFYFSSTVFRNAGITSNVYASICVGAANLFASLIATCLMERQGRRPLLIFSFSGMAIAMAVQASAAAFPMLSHVHGTLSVVATLMYVMMFAFGAGPVPGLLLPELLADCIRAKAMSIAMCIHWIFNFIVGLTFLQIYHKFGAAAVYSFFSAVCVVAVAFVSTVIVETKGKTLDEIQALLIAQDG